MQKLGKTFKCITLTFFKIYVWGLQFILRKITHGHGGTLPGYYLLQIFPEFLQYLETSFNKGLIIVSGTNGKTTTAKILTHVLRKEGYSVNVNDSGGNLLRGIITTLLSDYSWGRQSSDYTILEVDELTLPLILRKYTPDYLILTSLSRDQLDRYGEVDTIVEKWSDAFQRELSYVKTKVFACDLETEVKQSVKDFSGVKIYYGEENPEFLDKANLSGNFNLRNLNAVYAVVQHLSFTKDMFLTNLSDLSPAYGRGEHLTFNSKEFIVYLAKNPASFNHNLDLLLSSEMSARDFGVLVILSDDYLDGRDVSWIYDIDSEKLHSALKNRRLYCSGSRALDMAIRLSYAHLDIEPENITKDIAKILSKIKDDRIIVLPNYYSMLAFRKVVTGKRIL